MKKTENQEFLKDFKRNDKVNDWRGKKKASLKIAKRYESIDKKIEPEYRELGVHIRYAPVKRKVKDVNGNIIGEQVTTESRGLYTQEGKRVVNFNKRAKNMKFCGSELSFVKMKNNSLKLIEANFCRVPLCPMCQWRKALRLFYDTSKIMSVIEKRHNNLIPLFLTLTVKNCSPEELTNTLDMMYSGFNEFMRSRTLNPVVKGETHHIIKGWCRALEVTYNSTSLTFHPHLHLICFVDRRYFKSDDYLETEEWVQLWKASCKLDYNPICHICKVKSYKIQNSKIKVSSNNKRKSIAEIAKYTYKDREILKKTLSSEIQDNLIRYLSEAFHQRRLFAYGGVMKEIAAELKMKDVNKANLVKLDDKVHSSLVTMILKYKWNMGLCDYVLSDKIGVNNNCEEAEEEVKAETTGTESPKKRPKPPTLKSVAVNSSSKTIIDDISEIPKERRRIRPPIRKKVDELKLKPELPEKKPK